MNVEDGFQFKDLWPMVRRRSGVAGVVGGTIFLATILLAGWLPNRYSSSSTILVEPQAISERLIQSGLQESDLNKRLNIMTAQILSRPRLSRIIDDLGLYEDESDELTREEIIELMRQEIYVEPVLPELEIEGSARYRDIEINTFRITFWSDSAQTAAAVANRLANDFIEQHIRERVQLSGDTSEFIQAELERLTQRIREVESQIALVKEQNAGALPEDMDSSQIQLTRLQDRRQIIRNELALARSDVAFYEQQAAAAFDTPRYNDEQTNPARRRDALEISLGTYRAKGYTEKHPDVIRALMEIEEVEAIIENQQNDEDGPNNLAQQTAEAQRLRAEQRVASAQGELAEIQAVEDDLLDRLARTPRVAEQLAALDREWDHLSRKYREYSDKRLQAAVAADVERRQKGEQFRVLESAVAPIAPSSPNRFLIVAMGLVLGLALGGMTGLLVESADTSFHGARQMQGALRIPVLAAIPAIVLEPDRIAARRRALRNVVLVVGVVGVVLGASVLGYWVNHRTGGAAVVTQPAQPGQGG